MSHSETQDGRAATGAGSNGGAILFLGPASQGWAAAEQALRRDGFAVLCHGSLELALAAPGGCVPDLVIVDATGREFDAGEACRTLRAHVRFASLPVLMIVGDDNDEAIDEALAFGATDLFIGFRPARLLTARVRQLRSMPRSVPDLTDRREPAGSPWGRRESGRAGGVDLRTGLPHRKRFLAACSEAAARARLQGHELAVLSVDLHRFVHVNESLGDSAGDEVLRMVGARLAAALGSSPAGTAIALDQGKSGGTVVGAAASQALLARLPGAAFAILMPRIRDLAEVSDTTDHLLACLREPFVIADTECFVSVCIGIAIGPRDGVRADMLLSRADSALAKARLGGSQSVAWYAPPMQAEGRARLRMLSGLHRALDKNQLQLVYQPCVDAANRRLVGVEALARWTHEGAAVPPSEFIALAEQSGLIVRIGEWALREAGRQMRQWRDRGLQVPKVAVNISTLHFDKPSLAASVRKTIADFRLEPGSLEIELTESCMVRDLDRSLEAARALRQLGVNLALDDFGTGYSSLSCLTRLPIGTLKIDRSFVGLIGVSNEDEAVIRAIIALGRSLGLRVVAEGVETLAQARALLDMNCREMQGFLFSRPVPGPSLAGVVESLDVRWPLGARTLDFPAPRASGRSDGRTLAMPA